MSSTNGNPDVSPSNPLTLENPPPPAGTDPPPNRFILFTHSWLDLQNYIQQALALPINQGDFKEKYGDFADQALITNALAAMKNVQGLSSTFGSPATIKQQISQDPNYLFAAVPPAEIYGHIIWLATQIQSAADTFNFTFSSLQDLLSPSAGDPTTRANNLKTILVGQGGLVSTAEDMKNRTGVLLQKLVNFDTQITDANTQIQTYATSGSQLLTTANKLIGSMQDDIKNNLQPKADEAYKKWRDYTIAAVTTSVGITILTAGLLWPVGAALGIGLGIAAAKQRAAYNSLMDDIQKEGVEIGKKARLVTDMTGLNQSMTYVAPAMTTFKTNLGIIEGVWADIGGRLAYISNNYTVEQLSNYQWVQQTMKVLDAANKWKGISTTASEFTQNSLVSYDFSTKFGQKLPEAA